MEYTLGQTIAVDALLAHERDTHDGALILSGNRIYEVVIFFTVYLPIALVATRCCDCGIMKSDACVYNERERILDTDSPGLKSSIFSMGIDITSGIDKEIIVPKCEQESSSHIDCISFGDTTKVERLILSDGDYISTDESFGKICINYSLNLFEVRLIKRVAVSELRNLDERIEEPSCFLMFLT